VTAMREQRPIFVATWDFGAEAVRVAWAHWRVHGELAAACVEAAAAIELNPAIPTVGIGGLPNREGVVELDAGYMRGSDLSCGGVAALRVTCPAIRVARAVAEKTNHVMLAGRGADDFAIGEGFERYDPEAMLTETTRREYADWRASVAAGKADIDQTVGHDTVGVLGYVAGQTVACVATSGLGFKRPGRVGDSPIIGAGLYADDRAGCVAGTGIGEELYRHVAAVRIADAMANGRSASDAACSVLQRIVDADPANAKRGLSLIAIDRRGTVGAATTRTTNHRFEYHVCADGAFTRVEPKPIA
ncbi:MAG: isoaspartyl peptidase/L-asparaginase, partial [Phycisphaeraceae bacterium]